MCQPILISYTGHSGHFTKPTTTKGIYIAAIRNNYFTWHECAGTSTSCFHSSTLLVCWNHCLFLTHLLNVHSLYPTCIVWWMRAGIPTVKTQLLELQPTFYIIFRTFGCASAPDAVYKHQTEFLCIQGLYHSTKAKKVQHIPPHSFWLPRHASCPDWPAGRALFQFLVKRRDFTITHRL